MRQQYDQTVCSYQLTYIFQSKSTLCGCLNVKELLARCRHEIWSLSDCNWTRTHNHLVHKQTLNHLAKLAIFLVNEIIELCCEYLSVRCIWLYLLIMSCMHFRVNPHSNSCLNIKELLAWSRCEIWSLSGWNWTWTCNHLVQKQILNHLVKLFNNYGVHLTVCSYHVTYAFQNESTLYSCLNVKELLARSRHEIWSLSDHNWTRTHSHLVHKWTLNHLGQFDIQASLAKWLSVCLWTLWLWVWVQL